MAFASVMVPLDLGASAAVRLRLASTLARRFEARLIGLAARQALPQHLYGRGAYISSQFVDQASTRASEELSQVEARFREATAGSDDVEWRAAKTDPMAFLVRQARSADLVVVNPYREESAGDWCSSIEPGELVLRLGRPVLIAPPSVETLAARRIVVAWKDTREARRAVSDGLPFMRMAEEVLIVALGDEDDWTGAGETRAYLSRHGVTATTVLRPPPKLGVAAEVIAIAQREGADLIVAGAYGHTRMREVIFGSVTRTLLERIPICCLMSH
ncbi:universal stress protein [Methylobacterium sp. Leaf108]|uniref:universal stress protein n=1 Tax=Methylobacterium sp. Leaf108 TaxID=1736256 RepID=UPI0006FB0C7E|nr:universal stress protein [Methylobacterium sp. Leaf108]KQP55083.1 hypothetical protein ASF39_04960 [Methylobacterium sp. Leaf108]